MLKVSKSTLLHLRIPFSIFLMPVFLFALSISVQPDLLNIVLVFVILHMFIYPASNGYNSYFDEDKESIGGLEKPPPITKDLYYVSLLFDLTGIALALIISWQFAFMLFIYGVVSKAYSHRITRLKKYPWFSWLIIGIFQGFFTLWMAMMGLSGSGFEVIEQKTVWVSGVLSSIILLGSYPMTQVYQHNEDVKRGDITLSYLLGIRGTFLFSSTVFLIATVCFYFYFRGLFEEFVFFAFMAFMIPIFIFFNWWFVQVTRNRDKANFINAMRMNIISSICLSAFFILFYFYNN